ncbi:MAG TPA: alcohol dehydrogenase catalytic domain-containing protein [Roseiflexaceae bacterium]|nr:alcohol dehydrogenase catalytic domain-containing protein [Roseiflexaceae bacterium]
MKAAVLYGQRDMRIEERPVPHYNEREVLLRMLSVTICGSDVHYYTDGKIGTASIDQPIVMGHEFAAEVAAVGAQVHGLEVGQRVAVEPGISCGECEQCRHGYPNLCPHVRFCASPPFDGALQEYMAYPPHALFPLPDGMSAAEGAVLEPLCIAIKALDFGKLRVGETAAVIGGGAVGLLIVQLLRAAGATSIFLSEPVAYRREMAQRCGATALLDPGDPVTDLLQRTDGRDVDVVYEAATSTTTQRQATEMARIGGRVVLVGIPNHDEVSLHTSVMRRKGLTLTMVRRASHVYPRALALWARGLVDLPLLITHRLPLAETQRAFDLMADHADGVIRAAIEFDRA